MANDTAGKPHSTAKLATPTARKARKATTAKARTVALTAPPPAPPGWYPVDTDNSRWWDGQEWVGAQIPNIQVGDVADAAPNAPLAAREEEPNPEAVTITFRGRAMQIVRPTAEQLAIWQRIAGRAQELAAEAAKGAQPCPACKGVGKVQSGDCEDCRGTGDARTASVLKLYHRAMKIINALLVERDQDWLEDQMIDGTVDLEAAGEIVSRAIDALTEAKDKAVPTAGPVHKPKAQLRR